MYTYMYMCPQTWAERCGGACMVRSLRLLTSRRCGRSKSAARGPENCAMCSGVCRMYTHTHNIPLGVAKFLGSAKGSKTAECAVLPRQVAFETLSTNKNARVCGESGS